MSDQIEYRIGKYRVRMTTEQAAYWNRQAAYWNRMGPLGPLGPFLFSQLHGAKIQLGGYWVTLEGAMWGQELLDEIRNEEAVALTSAPPAL